MPRYMLDTDISSYVMKRSHQAVLDRLLQTQIRDICISVITRAELEYGVAVSPRPAKDRVALDEYLRHVAVLDFPDEASLHYADVRQDLKLRGQMIGANDLLVAAHARFLGLTLVTNNDREFGKVSGLRVENWTLEWAIAKTDSVRE
jgi:tRNA(fMet)-specific endonuclease VapC